MNSDPQTTPLSPLAAARTLLQQGRFWQAVPVLKALVASEPANPDAWELLGVAQSLYGNKAAARDAFRQAVQHGPNRASAHYNYAAFLFDNGDEDQAAEENQVALFVQPGHPGALALQKRIEEKVRFRDYTADQGFASVGTTGRLGAAINDEWKKLQCPTCGAMNLLHARVCKKCNSYIPEMKDVIPVE